MIIDDNSNKCPEQDSNSMDVEMEPANSHSNGACILINQDISTNPTNCLEQNKLGYSQLLLISRFKS